MPDKSDVQLLHDYAERGQETAFREIVERYADLVYSSALRQLNSPDSARDVSQSVFLDLARKADSLCNQLPENASLIGWLYRSTRFAALNHLRDDRRRATRERQAMEQLLTDSAPSPDWERIRPLLDEAMSGLNDDDREALLLRYFKNHDFRAVGATLRISDDTAQKRVSRAVERLREIFAKHGVYVSASGLVVVISSNAIQAAPAGLNVIIGTTALAGVTAGTILTTQSTAITMSLINTKTIAVVAAAAIVAGGGTYFAQQTKLNQLRSENQALLAQQDNLAKERERALTMATTRSNELEKLEKDKTDLLRLRNEVGTLRKQAKELDALQADNRQLQASLAKSAQTDKTPDADDDPDRKMAVAKINYARQLVLAMLMHAGDNQNRLPNRLEQLAPYIDAKDANFSVTNQFEVVAHGSADAIPSPSTTIAVREKQPTLAKGKWTKAYGFVDGHAELKTQPDEGFDAWEAQHILPPVAGNQ